MENNPSIGDIVLYTYETRHVLDTYRTVISPAVVRKVQIENGEPWLELYVLGESASQPDTFVVHGVPRAGSNLAQDGMRAWRPRNSG